LALTLRPACRQHAALVAVFDNLRGTG